MRIDLQQSLMRERYQEQYPFDYSSQLGKNDGDALLLLYQLLETPTYRFTSQLRDYLDKILPQAGLGDKLYQFVALKVKFFAQNLHDWLNDGVKHAIDDVDLSDDTLVTLGDMPEPSQNEASHGCRQLSGTSRFENDSPGYG